MAMMAGMRPLRPTAPIHSGAGAHLLRSCGKRSCQLRPQWPDWRSAPKVGDRREPAKCHLLDDADESGICRPSWPLMFAASDMREVLLRLQDPHPIGSAAAASRTAWVQITYI
jgi:hypothetical protein